MQQRFFPIFSLLFGIGFGMMWSRARERSQGPRLVLLRRILFLLALGIPHEMVHPGEALLPYATVALVILLPATWIPQRWLVPVTAGLGALSLVGLLAIGGGSIMIVPSLLLLGLPTPCPVRLSTVKMISGCLFLLAQCFCLRLLGACIGSSIRVAPRWHYRQNR